MSSKIKVAACSTLFVVIAFGAMAIFSTSKPQLTQEQLAKKVFDYPTHWVKERCKKDHGYTDEDVTMLERELKRFLLMCMLKETKDIDLGMFSKHVDNFWHSFILFTKDYENFCLSTNGSFIHHFPEIDEVSKNLDPEYFAKIRGEYRQFIQNYEKIFNEEIHPIWLLDGVEKI